VIPALKKADAPTSASSGKGKGKDQSGDAAASTSSSAVAAPSTQVLTSSMNDGKDPLDLLHPYEKTVGYLYIL